MAAFRHISNSTGCTIVLIHHLRKLSGQLTKVKIADRIRGSGDFLGAVDSAIILSTKGEGSSLVRNMIHVKCREAEESDPLSFEIQEGETGGLMLTFGLGDAAIASETLAQVALGMMVEAMQSEPGVAFSKDDLRSVIAEAGLTNLSTRSMESSFKMIRRLSEITCSKVGKFNHYSWTPNDTKYDT
ncbi:MAG: hypothetical protein IIC78_15155, partial [Chloroflexi bacterium]|nr:hypothetical protein [Chloroflexota bacterium]